MNMRVSWPTRWVDYGFRLAYQVAYPIMCRCKCFYRADGVVIAVWAQGGRLLVVRHSYKPGLSIPGGGKRSKETPSEAAIRELGEEVGMKLREAVEHAGVRLLMSREYANGGRNYFMESTIPFEPTLMIDRREIIYAAFVKPSEINRSTVDRYFGSYLDLMEKTFKNAA